MRNEVDKQNVTKNGVDKMDTQKNKFKVGFIAAESILSDFQRQQFLNEYNANLGVQQTYGEIVARIMKNRGINARRAAQLTGLRENLFYNLDKPDGKVLKRFIISIAAGFNLNMQMTSLILALCGMKLTSFDFTDAAYTYVLEQHKDKDISQINRILKELGVSEKDMLGTLERGYYKKRKNSKNS